MKHALHKNRTSVLMYPEASYSFDGTATPLPRKMGVLLKALKVPLVMITAYGSFARDPLYNNLQKRNVKVSAEMECLLTIDEIRTKSIEEGNYLLDTDVEIGLIVDFKALYMVGSGHLRHDRNGFVLDGCDGALHYEQGPLKCYSVYSDYYWYEIGDVICIGNKDCLYYCFPKKKDVVAKTRIAVEELYKMNKDHKASRSRG